MKSNWEHLLATSKSYNKRFNVRAFGAGLLVRSSPLSGRYVAKAGKK